MYRKLLAISTIPLLIALAVASAMRPPEVEKVNSYPARMPMVSTFECGSSCFALTPTYDCEDNSSCAWMLTPTPTYNCEDSSSCVTPTPVPPCTDYWTTGCVLP